jgi:hypothetical protein
MKSPAFKNSCCKLDIVERYDGEPPSKQVPPGILKTHPVHDILHDIKQKEAETYEKRLDGFPDTQAQIFKKDCQILPHGKIHTVKKKLAPLPKRKNQQGKSPMRWLDMFKWNPKHVMHSVEDVSLKEAPF